MVQNCIYRSCSVRDEVISMKKIQVEIGRGHQANESSVEKRVAIIRRMRNNIGELELLVCMSKMLKWDVKNKA